MTPAVVLSSVVAVLALAYFVIWLSAHLSGNRRSARAARDGLVVHLAFSAVFSIVLGVTP